MLSLGESELIVKIGGESGHFFRHPSITQAIRKQRQEEAEQALREFAIGTATVAAVLALGGIAVLCGVAGSSSALEGSGGTGSDSRPSPSTGPKKLPPATGETSKAEPVRRKEAVALQGAVIVGSDGRNFSYKKRCDCGHIEPGLTNQTIPTAGSTINTSFRCSKCGKMQEVRIQGYE